MLTALKPIIAKRRGSGGVDDVYEAVGEPIGVRHLCAGGMSAAGWDLPPNVPTRVLFSLAPDALRVTISQHGRN